MYNKIKNCLKLSVVFGVLLCTTFSFAQQYQIHTVVYNSNGRTLQYPLKKAVEIDTTTVFSSQEALDTYVDYLIVQFNNLRVLETATIDTTFGEEVNTIVPVNLTITTEDSTNFIVFPMPKYSTGSGFSIKLDSKDYNFLGTMETLDAEFFYNFDFADKTDPTSKDTHSFGIYGGYSYPFAIGSVDSSWNNKLGLSYTVGHSAPSVDFSTGLGFYYPITDILAFNLSCTQGIVYDQDYESYGDEFYFSESASFSMPLTLVSTPNFGNFTWTPSISTRYYWDFDRINLLNEDLCNTTVSFGHSFSLGTVNWIGNFKDGFSFSFGQTLALDFCNNNFSTSTYLESKYFKSFEHLGIKSRFYFFQMENTSRSFDGSLRGVYGSGVNSDSGIIVNFDLPITVWQTDWVGYGFWNWMRYVDFEMQISPFFDMAIGQNSKSGRTYSPKDGFYTAGIEVVGYPTKFRNVQGRISFGIDLVNFASKLGKNSDFFDKLANKFFDTGWRTDNWYELSIGIGLFY